MDRISKTKIAIVAGFCLWVVFLNSVYVTRTKKYEHTAADEMEIKREFSKHSNLSSEFLNSLLNSMNQTLSNNVSISVCIPAIASDMKSNLPRLLQSINIQTQIPFEVIIVMSNTKETDCIVFKQRLKSVYNASVLHLHCVVKLQYQSISRQKASTFARGTVISFIDADDVMFPNRIQVISSLFRKFKSYMVLHAFSNKAKPIWNDDWKEARIMDGIKLFDIAKQTRPHHAWLIEEIMLSQVSVYKDVCRLVEFRTDKKFYRIEDAWFVRDVISYFGRKSNTAIFINFALSWHVPREFQIRRPFWQVPQEFHIRKPSQNDFGDNQLSLSVGSEAENRFHITSRFTILSLFIIIFIIFFLSVKNYG